MLEITGESVLLMSRQLSEPVRVTAGGSSLQYANGNTYEKDVSCGQSVGTGVTGQPKADSLS